MFGLLIEKKKLIKSNNLRLYVLNTGEFQEGAKLSFASI